MGMRFRFLAPKLEFMLKLPAPDPLSAFLRQTFITDWAVGPWAKLETWKLELEL